MKTPPPATPPVSFRRHPLLLHFLNPGEESGFRMEWNRNSLLKVRMAILLGILLYAGFLLLDAELVPEGFATQVAIRLGVVTPVLALMFMLTFLDMVRARLQPIAVVSILATGIGHFAMPFFTILPESYVTSCTNLVIIFLFVFSGIRFSTALVIAALLIPLHALTELLVSGTDALQMLHKAFFLLSTTAIGILAGHTIERSLRVEYAQKETIRAQQEKIEHELSMARKIQSRLIPVTRPGNWLSYHYQPMEQVGGDFFDFVSFRDGDRTGIFISDVSGHGVPAAFITSMLKSTLLQSGERREDPAALLGYINGVLERHTDGNFITALYGIYSRSTRTFHFANAGHNAPILIGDEITYLEGNRSRPLAVT